MKPEIETHSAWTANVKLPVERKRRWLSMLIMIIFGAILASLFLPDTVFNQTAEYYPVKTVYIPSDNVNDLRTLTATVTAYSEYDSCHYANCVMANGQRAYIGAIACPRNLKFGTQIVIMSKVYTCADRTAKRYDGRYDIFTGYGQEAYDQAIQFGKQVLTVKIYE